MSDDELNAAADRRATSMMDGIIKKIVAKQQDGFHQHLDQCRQCREQPFNLCSTGTELIRKAVDDVAEDIPRCWWDGECPRPGTGNFCSSECRNNFLTWEGQSMQRPHMEPDE